MPPRPSPSTICRRCLHSQTRHSSTSKRSSIPPESPSFIHVPEPVQAPNYEPLKPIKGVLPVSRNIFGKHGEYRATEPYKAQVTPEPSRARVEPKGPEADRIKFKRELSYTRRQTLREGISEIWARKERTEEVQGRKSGLKVLRNKKAASAPAPLDETLTTPSLHPSVRLLLATNNAAGPSPTKPSKYPEIQEQKSAARKEALHNLYVNAQHFIVNENQLNEELEKVFGTDENPVRWGETNGVWGLMEKPRTASEMLGIQRKGAGAEVDVSGAGRMKRIGDVLTGGAGSRLWEEQKA